ncbi:MAG TPA: EAL domain-containing protein [Candidatus Elarobacter sp.]|jgi:photoactive yellow protein|nr:EAL domain-containing protein [Candidatus Elarobacter sp.]
MQDTEDNTPAGDVFELSREDLDALPYGVITLDRRGTVLRYNRAEANYAHRAHVRTIGLNFFADVAPCANVRAFRGRFDEFAGQPGSGVERFDFSYAFRWGRQDVTITLLRKAEHPDVNLVVRRRTMAANAGEPEPVAVRSLPSVKDDESAGLPSARESELRRLAYYDDLTELANRTRLLERVAEAVRETRATGGLAALAFIDLAGFTAVNETFGYPAGDGLLRAVALRLGECVRAGDTLARLDGDEFVALFTGVDDAPSVERMVRRIFEVLAQPVDLGGRLHYVAANVGISAAPYHGSDPVDLLHAADSAMRAAKASGRNTLRWYSAETAEAAAANVRTEEDLRRALERDELVVYYQPIVDAATGRIAAAEALVRWRHPARGIVMPGEFITVAEESGLIAPLGELVLRDACRRAREWNALGLERRVCVNVSTAQLREKHFTSRVRAILAETGVDPARLELELTESMMIDGFEETLDTLTDLKLLGLRLAVDDFGTGYSSLAYLKYLPVDTIKLDRAFVAGIAEDEFDHAIATAVLALARDLELECIAEGVETEAQAQVLRELGCPLLQGYLFGRPQPAGAFERESAPRTD